MKRYFALVSALCLGACGVESSQSASDFKSQTAQAATDGIRIAIIGNSITSHAIKPSVGWTHVSGMAASSIQQDYAHLLLAKIGAKPSESYVRNFYPFETDANGAAANIASLTPVMADAPDTVVIELGDNVSARSPVNLFAFNDRYAQLIAKVKPAKNLFCLSTWWGSKYADWIIERQCKAGGGKYVYIGDIYPDQVASAPAPHFAEAGVEKHPKDVAMQRIAYRLWMAGVRL
jgi:hypothetical protein